MTSFVLGAVTVLAAWGWGPRLTAWAAAYRQHRRWMRHFKQREQTQPLAAPLWHGETTQEFQALVRNLVFEEPT
jgi:hypothetical protein